MVVMLSKRSYQPKQERDHAEERGIKANRRHQVMTSIEDRHWMVFVNEPHRFGARFGQVARETNHQDKTKFGGKWFVNQGKCMGYI